MKNEILWLIKKEIKVEWRLRFAINGILLYLISTIFIAYLSFSLQSGTLTPATWNALFWIIILFTGVNGIAKSFLQEKEERWLYYYTITSGQKIIISKLIYNACLMLILGVLGFMIYSVILGNPVVNIKLFSINLLLASIGFSSALTMISAIVSKANNNFTLMAVLGFPILIPILLMAIKTSAYALAGLGFEEAWDELLTTGAIIMIIASVSYILFPYLWRS